MSAEEELEQAKAQVALKELEVAYQAALDRHQQGNETEAQLAEFREARDAFAAARSEIRRQREASEMTVAEGDAVVRPGPVGASVGVHPPTGEGG
jgi:hypothetical protein